MCTYPTSNSRGRTGVTHAHVCLPPRKWPPVRTAVDGGNAGSPERSSFRENPTNILTFVARWVRDIDFRTNRRSRGEMWLNGQTNRQTHRPNYITLTAHARWGLNIGHTAHGLWIKVWAVPLICPRKSQQITVKCFYSSHNTQLTADVWQQLQWNNNIGVGILDLFDWRLYGLFFHMLHKTQTPPDQGWSGVQYALQALSDC